MTGMLLWLNFFSGHLASGLLMAVGVFLVALIGDRRTELPNDPDTVKLRHSDNQVRLM